jgi:hypothetical protein
MFTSLHFSVIYWFVCNKTYSFRRNQHVVSLSMNDLVSLRQKTPTTAATTTTKAVIHKPKDVFGRKKSAPDQKDLTGTTKT